jgi:hypothetical protein
MTNLELMVIVVAAACVGPMVQGQILSAIADKAFAVSNPMVIQNNVLEPTAPAKPLELIFGD